MIKKKVNIELLFEMNNIQKFHSKIFSSTIQDNLLSIIVEPLSYMTRRPYGDGKQKAILSHSKIEITNFYKHECEIIVVELIPKYIFLDNKTIKNFFLSH